VENLVVNVKDGIGLMFEFVVTGAFPPVMCTSFPLSLRVIYLTLIDWRCDQRNKMFALAFAMSDE
jgi:hypothetical protein